MRFHYTSIGLCLLPSLPAPVSLLPPAAQPPWLCYVFPSQNPFPPSCFFYLLVFFLTVSLFAVLSLPSSGSFLLTIVAIIQTVPPYAFLHCHPPFLSSCPASSFLSFALHLAVARLCSHVSTSPSPSAIHLPSNPFLPLHFPECYWWWSWLLAKENVGLKWRLAVCSFLWLAPLLLHVGLYISRFPLQIVFMHITLFPLSFSLLSLCCLPAFPMSPACKARVAAVASKTEHRTSILFLVKASQDWGAQMKV